MQDNGKTKEQLLDELAETRQRIAELETAQRQSRVAQKQLRESESNYRGLVDRANDAILIVQDGTIKYANKRLAQMGGYSIRSIINTPLVDYVHPDALARADSRSGAGRSDAPPSGEACESVLKRKDGGALLTEVSTDAISYGGRPADLVLIRDVTETKRIQRREWEYVHDLMMLSRSAIDLVQLSPEDDVYRFAAQRLGEFAPGAVVIVNAVDDVSTAFQVRAVVGVGDRMDTLVKIMGQHPVGATIPINGEARASLTSARLERLADGLYQLAAGGLPSAMCCAIERVLDLGDAYAMGFCWRGQLLGSAILLMRRGSVPRNPTAIETFVNQVAVALRWRQAEANLTEAVEELTRSNSDLAQFAYVVSHDLREPLRMVASYVELLERRYKDRLDADADDFIAYALDGSRRMQQLIDDVLVYSRVDSQRRPLEATDCNLAFRDAVANLHVAIEESGAVVTHDRLPRIAADGTQVVSLLQNLIGNAVKFRSQSVPQVHVSADQHEDEWVFCVSDNGIGIPREEWERIFMLSHRLHSATEYPGTGLGLAICKKIAERHGGRIWVTSQPGKGSRFYFTIPEEGGTQP